MGYRTLADAVRDLQATGQLRPIDAEIDPHLEAAAIQRRVYEVGGPAILFRRLKGTSFPAIANLFGTRERTHFLFRDTLETVRRLVELKVRPPAALRRPLHYRRVPLAALNLLPRRVRRGPILAHRTSIDRLPPIVSWPLDGGPFITLPQVYTEDPDRPGLARSNLGMYRVQLSGNDYEANREVGLHYQIHRGIGVHHASAIRRGEPLRVNVFVGGAPAMAVAAVMPLPEGLPELAFAGALGGHRVRMVTAPENGLPIPAEADFAIVGTVDPSRSKPEGPFGDHLGYYSLRHDFPVLRVEAVYHRPGAIWPFTSVGRPPQEDTSFGELIHELTGPLVPTVLPGVSAVHAVDAAGVHPLLLAIGSERYVPYAPARRPQEGSPHPGQRDPRPGPDVPGEIPLHHREGGRARPRHPRRRRLLPPRPRAGRLGERPPLPDPDDDRHARLLGPRAQPGLEARRRRRRAEASRPADFDPRGAARLPEGFGSPKVALPGVLVVQAPPGRSDAGEFAAAIRPGEPPGEFPLRSSWWTIAISRPDPCGTGSG